MVTKYCALKDWYIGRVLLSDCQIVQQKLKRQSWELSVECCMNVSNVFYDDWECFNEVLPSLLLANRPHRGTRGRQEGRRRTNITVSQSYLGHSQARTRYIK